MLLLFCANSFAKNWKKVAENKKESSFYVDVDNIKENDGYIHYLVLTDYLEPTKFDAYSIISKYKVNCEVQKQIWLGNTFFSKPMGNGKIITEGIPAWNYYGSTLNEIRRLESGTTEHGILKKICNFFN